MVAVHLLRARPELAANITIVEPRSALGAGLAYSATDPAHRINVPAATMTLFPDDPLHFERWLLADGALDADPDAVLPDGRAFPQRAVFGRYLASLLAEADPSGQVRHVRDRAVAAVPCAGGFRIGLASAEALHADVLVLALGHPPPSTPSGLRGIPADHPGLAANPWDAAALARIARRPGPVLIVGTALTMGDVTATLRREGFAGEIIALSRRGLRSRRRSGLMVTPYGEFADPPSRTASALLARVRAVIAQRPPADAPSGVAWEGVVQQLRNQAVAVWQALPPVERRRLLRHVRPFWDVHRYAVAPQIDDLIVADRADGRLRVLAARLLSAEAVQDRLRVRVQLRGGDLQALDVGSIVNCTGPGHRDAVDSFPPLATLAAAGVVVADSFGLGIEVDADSRALRSDGSANPALFVAGPAARGRFGELMGMPQVSNQPGAVAEAINRLTPLP